MMQINTTYTKGHKTEEANYVELYAKHEAKSTKSGAYTGYMEISMHLNM